MNYKNICLSYLIRKWERLKLFFPLVTDEDALMLVATQLRVMPLFQSKFDILLHHPRMQSVGYIEKIVSITLSSFGVMVWKILRHVL